MWNRFLNLADSDMLMFSNGKFHFTQNMSFADKLDEISSELVLLSNRCKTTAADIRTNVRRVQNRQTSQNDNVDLPPTDNDDRDEDDQSIQMKTSIADTKFKYVKSNKNGPSKFICPLCKKSFRNDYDLRNHEGQHTKEFYHCLKCSKVFRTVRSFENHRGTHGEQMFTCPIEDCRQQFSLRSSMQNHMQKHSKHRFRCTVLKSCKRKYRHQQSILEHEKWAHRITKDCPCPICGKKFQTPTNMRSHKRKQHGLVKHLVEGYSLVIPYRHKASQGQTNSPSTSNASQPKQTVPCTRKYSQPCKKSPSHSKKKLRSHCKKKSSTESTQKSPLSSTVSKN